MATALVAACGDDSGSPVDDFDWDALFARDTSDSGGDARPDTVFGPPDLGPDGVEPEGSSYGDSCVRDAVCDELLCLEAPAFPGGYCTTTGCTRARNCPDGTTCTSLEELDFCAVDCETDADCRDQYRCNVDALAGPTCVPAVYVELAADGEACTSDSDCRGGSCLLDENGWPGGTCTTLGCTGALSCATNDRENRCVLEPDTSKCLRECANDSDCRQGYLCREGFGAAAGRICRPDIETPVDVPTDVPYPFTLHCELAADDEGRVNIDFTIGEATAAWALVPFSRDGEDLLLESLALPDGSSFDFLGVNAFQTFGSYWFGSINPILVPGIPALASQVQSGTHRLSIETDSTDLCWYLLEEAEAGTTIDLDVVLVDVPGVDAASAPADLDLGEVIDGIDAVFASAGISVGEVRYFDAAEDVADDYRIIRGNRDALELAETSVLRGETMDDALRMNLFFTRGFNFGGVIGISMGIPGAPGLHGSPSSAVVFTSEYLGDAEGNALTAQLIAHELGHFLGLFHTTEMDSAAFDNLADTPECRSGFPDGCPDRLNLMFPFAGADHTELSFEQGRVIQYNPLTKP